jgi:hypothetical protein
LRTFRASARGVAVPGRRFTCAVYAEDLGWSLVG